MKTKNFESFDFADQSIRTLHFFLFKSYNFFFSFYVSENEIFFKIFRTFFLFWEQSMGRKKKNAKIE